MAQGKLNNSLWLREPSEFIVSLWCRQLLRKTQSDPQSPCRDLLPSCHGHRGLDAHSRACDQRDGDGC